jgi:hypothetical protein
MFVAPDRTSLDPTPARAAPAGPPSLAAVGLVTGERVRWRQKAGGRWREGRVVGRERDGSIGIRDGTGASRALRLERLEVTAEGPRGAKVWEAATERAARAEQMALWAAAPAERADVRRR